MRRVQRIVWKAGLILAALSLLTVSVAAFTVPKGYATLPVDFSPVAGVQVRISSRWNAVMAQLPRNRLQSLGEMPDIPLGSMQIDNVILQDDFNFDGAGDIAILDGVGYGGVNLFYRLYTWDKQAGDFVEFKELLSNPTLTSTTQTLSTGQRSGPRWLTTDYRFHQGKPYIWSESMLVGGQGNLFVVSIYDERGRLLRKLLAHTDDPSSVDVQTPTATQTLHQDQVVLYSRPGRSHATQLRLKRGEKLTLLDYVQQADGSEWFRVRTQGSKALEKWVEWQALND